MVNRATIDIINSWTLGLSDTKKLELLALYVDTLLAAGLINHANPASLEDFIEEVFNGPDGTVGCCPKGPPGERGEPGIPDDAFEVYEAVDDIKARYDELLEPLEDLGSLGAVPEDEAVHYEATTGESTIVRIDVPSTHLTDCIEIMKKPGDSELPPPGTTIQGIAHAAIGEPPTAAFAAILVSAEGGPFIDAYLQKDEDIICEHKPIRDTEFLESRTRISMQYEDRMYEFEIVSTDV